MEKMVNQIILASASPRRKEILQKLGIPFKIEGNSYEENMSLDLPPADLAIHLSRGKAETVASKHTNALVIGADTFIVFQGNLLGKPRSPEEAKQTLKKLSGQKVSIITGFTIINTMTDEVKSKVSEASVTLKDLTDEDINEYVASGDPLDKAGSFAIQTLGAILIEKIEGDFLNIMGLPLGDLTDTLKEMGISVWELRRNSGVV